MIIQLMKVFCINTQVFQEEDKGRNCDPHVEYLWKSQLYHSLPIYMFSTLIFLNTNLQAPSPQL